MLARRMERRAGTEGQGGVEEGISAAEWVTRATESSTFMGPGTTALSMSINKIKKLKRIKKIKKKIKKIIKEIKMMTSNKKLVKYL